MGEIVLKQISIYDKLYDGIRIFDKYHFDRSLGGREEMISKEFYS